MSRHFFTLGAVLAGLAVMAGAFGAHALAGYVSEARLGTFQTGVTYHMYHGIALMITGWISRTEPQRFKLAGYCFLAGILFFSGSLYLLVLTDTGWLGAVTPIGGLLFIAGWLILAFRYPKA